MGDEPVSAVPDAGQADHNPPQVVGSRVNAVGSSKTAAFDGDGIPYHAPQHPVPSQHAFSTQFDMTTSPPPQTGRSGPYNMTPLSNALPHVGFRPGQYPSGTQQRFPPANSPSVMHQMPQQYAGPSVAMGNQGYYVPQQHMSPYYGGSPISPTQAQPSGLSRPTVAYYPNQMMVNHSPSTYYFPQGGSYPPQAQSISTSMLPGQYIANSPLTPTDPRTQAHGLDNGFGSTQSRRQSHNDSDRRQSTVRGPPRKPRQSGHAIWIGNLPPQTDLMNLVHHVCQETPGLESLFLISKSNCAFANFKDESSCAAAQQKLHDSKFQTVRLVSRLRKSTVEGASGVTAPTGPAATASSPTSGTGPDLSQKITPPDSDRSTPSTGHSSQPRTSPIIDSPKQDKFFVLKSLTVEDLELSVRTGIWATQVHNEESLNKAFKSADNVFLVFSANKSGEYFGYARMMSEINEDPAAQIQFAPKVQATTDLDLPKAIPTEATEHAPKGRIIDDSARGTIFWEAERDDAESRSDGESEETGSVKSGSAEEGTQTWGKPFHLEWLSSTRLPFYRTRGLRNPWNSNREVKIARDGTELEPSVGRKLIGLFNRVQSPGPVPAALHGPMPMMPGYPQMRPYGR